MTATNPMGESAQNPSADLPPSPIANVQERLLRRPEVIQITTLPSSSITDMVRAGTFPAPLKLSERTVAWRLSEIQAWMDNCQRAGGAA